MGDDEKAQPEEKPSAMPPAGPHATPELMDEEKTPGTGALPPIGEDDDGNMQPTS
jgi:hypothetical protein